MDKIKNLILLLSFLFFCNSALATVINDGEGVLVDDVRWLDLSLTVGVSYSNLSTLFPDYRIANSNEVEQMFKNYATLGDVFFGDIEADYLHDEFSFYNKLGKIGPSPFTFKNASFFTDFGYTFHRPRTSTHGEKIMSMGLSLDSDKTLAHTGLYTYTPAITDYRYGEESLNRASGVLDDSNLDLTPTTTGWFLVENNIVPEPSILALFAAGLFGIGFARRRKQQA